MGRTRHSIEPSGRSAHDSKGGMPPRRRWATEHSYLFLPHPPCAKLLQNPLPTLLTSVLATLRARTLEQIHRQVGMAQLGNKVDGDNIPGASPGVPDHVVLQTILQTGDGAVLSHHASGAWGGSGDDDRVFQVGGRSSRYVL